MDWLGLPIFLKSIVLSTLKPWKQYTSFTILFLSRPIETETTMNSSRIHGICAAIDYMAQYFWVSVSQSSIETVKVSFDGVSIREQAETPGTNAGSNMWNIRGISDKLQSKRLSVVLKKMESLVTLVWLTRHLVS